MKSIYFGILASLIAQAGCTKDSSDPNDKNPNHKEISGKPSIRSVYPKEGSSKGDVLIHISVGNISKSASITLNGSPCTLPEIYEHSETAFCRTSPHAPARADLIITNPGGEADTLSQAFEFVKDPSDIQKEIQQQAEKEKQHLAHQLRESERKHQEELQKLRNEHFTREVEERERRRLVDEKHTREQAAIQTEKARLEQIRVAQERTAQLQETVRRESQNDQAALTRLRAQLGADQTAFDRQNSDLAAARQRLTEDQAALARLRQTYQENVRALSNDRGGLAQEQARLTQDRRALEALQAEVAERENQLTRDEENVATNLQALAIQQEELNALLERHRAVEVQHAQARLAEDRRNREAQVQAVLARLAPEPEQANPAPVVTPQAPPAAQHPVWQVRSPELIQPHDVQLFQATRASIAQQRTNLEDVHTLYVASLAEFKARKQNPIPSQFGDLVATFKQGSEKANAYLDPAHRGFYLTHHSTEYQGIRYRTNFDFITGADPYFFIEKELSSLDHLGEVSDARMAEIKQLLIASLQVDGGPDADERRRHRVGVLTEMLSHYDLIANLSAEVRTRKGNLRKRLNRLVETISLHSESPQARTEQLGLLATIMEGDNERHCLDGLQTQANLADAHFLGMAVEPKGFGDHISRTLRHYRTQFIDRHRLLYNALSADFDEKEAHTYAPIGLMRTMMLTFGLLTELEPVAHARYFPLNNEDLGDARKILVRPEKVMERFLEGSIHLTGFGREVKFEAYDPKLMIHLLDLTSRRGLPLRTLRHDAEASNQKGIKITPAYIQSQFMPAHPSDFARQNPEFARALKEDFENFFAELPSEGDESKYFKMVKDDQVLPKEAFWTEMLIHYGYLVPAE